MTKLAFLKKLNRRWSRVLVSYRGGFILAIPAVCIIAILITWSKLRQDAIAVHQQIDRSETTLIETNNLLQLLSSAEIGVRGYVITQQADFLEPYEQAVVNLPQCIDKLANLHRDTPKQQDVQEIAKLAKEELDLLTQTIDYTRQENTLSEVNALLTQSKRKISRTSAKIGTFRSQEWQALSDRRQKLFDLRDITNAAFWSAAIVSLLSFLAALYLFNLLERELNSKQEILRSHATELADLNRTLATTNNTLEERNSELDRFCYIVSHDLKAPLRGINNLSEWIEEDSTDLTEDTRKYLHLQRERIARMENLIDGLLQYARVGRQNAPIETVDVRQLLENVIDSIDPPPNFAIAIQNEMPIINTQRLHLEQVFSNLISNGVKHHPRSDGKITISVKEQENFYEFAVADDGAGIAPLDREKIFNIFYTSNSKSDKFSTGVGLAIVKKIVEEHGGTISVTSKIGIGTTFLFQWAK